MSATSCTGLQKRTTLVLPILVGSAVAGTLDLIAAFVSMVLIGLPIAAACARF